MQYDIRREEKPGEVLYYLVYFHWSVVALSYCGSACCTARRVRYTHTCMPSSVDFPPARITIDHPAASPVLRSLLSLVTQLILSRACTSVSLSQSIPTPCPPQYPHIILYTCVYISALQIISPIQFFFGFHIHTLIYDSPILKNISIFKKQAR